MSSDDEREEKELVLASPEVVTKYKSAAEIVNKALQKVICECKPKAKVLDVCEIGDAYITEQTGNMYKSSKKKTEKGVAFPSCISVNNTVCHFSQPSTDESVFEEGDIIKIDSIHALQSGPITGRAADAIAGANTAAEVALRLVKPGKKEPSPLISLPLRYHLRESLSSSIIASDDQGNDIQILANYFKIVCALLGILGILYMGFVWLFKFFIKFRNGRRGQNEGIFDYIYRVGHSADVPLPSSYCRINTHYDLCHEREDFFR